MPSGRGIDAGLSIVTGEGGSFQMPHGGAWSSDRVNLEC